MAGCGEYKAIAPTELPDYFPLMLPYYSAAVKEVIDEHSRYTRGQNFAHGVLTTNGTTYRFPANLTYGEDYNFPLYLKRCSLLPLPTVRGRPKT